MRVHSFSAFVIHKTPMDLDLVLSFCSVDDCAVNSEIHTCVVEWQCYLPLAELDREYLGSAEKVNWVSQEQRWSCCKRVLGGAMWGSGTRNAFWAVTWVWVVHEVGTRRAGVCVCVSEREIGRQHEKWGCSCGLVPDVWGSYCLLKSLDLFSEGVFHESVLSRDHLLFEFCLVGFVCFPWAESIVQKSSLASRSQVISVLVQVKGDGDLNWGGGGRDRGGGQLSGDSSCRMIDEQENTAGPRVPSTAEWPSLSRLEGDKTI